MNNQNTVVYVKLKGKRPEGVANPPKFEWNLDKDRHLWGIVSRLENYQDQIDWEGLSQEMNVPDYFLKKRSYKLFTKHLKLLEQQIERKIKIGNDDKTQRSITSQTENSDVVANVTSYDQGSLKRSSNTDNLEKNTTIRTLQQLHTSKILSRPRQSAGNSKDIRSNNQVQSTSDSESSSSISVSNSALEEALMDRLKL